MKHTSVKMDYPIEFVNVTPVNPLISKCQIKVCYVSDKPNRNKSIITKEVAKQLANSIPGSPIVGYFNEQTQDFEQHNRILKITDRGDFKLVDGTRPYGFVDLNAKVWFQKFLDDNADEREYLMTEGWLWTGQYPEAKRVIEKGNNHSMELDDKIIDAFWTKDNKGKPEFFIINEAIMSKLCILGEEYEPCFETAGIRQEYTNLQFSFDEGFKSELFSMMEQMKEILNEGGAPLISKYAVEIGDSLWTALYENTDQIQYRINGVYEEDNQTFAVLQSRTDDTFHRVNFSVVEDVVTVEDSLTDITETYENDCHFTLDAIESFETEYAKKKKKSEEDEEEPADEGDKKPADDGNKEPAEESADDDDDEKKKKKKKYNLEEVTEYVSLQSSYNELETKYNNLVAEYSALQSTVDELNKFKAKVEKKEKQAMIDSFYMLSESDKKDVIDNIDTYSLSDIEAKLSIICVRNKVSFDLDVDTNVGDTDTMPTTYNLGDSVVDDAVPAWVKAIQQNVARNND